MRRVDLLRVSVVLRRAGRVVLFFLKAQRELFKHNPFESNTQTRYRVTFNRVITNPSELSWVKDVLKF